MRHSAKRPAALLAWVALLLATPAPAAAEFGIADVKTTFTKADGSAVTQAGSHPYEMKTTFSLNTVPTGLGWDVVEGAVRDLEVLTPVGFAGEPAAVPRCTTIDFLATVGGGSGDGCADSSAVGYLTTTLGNGEVAPPVIGGPYAVYNLFPAPGMAARLGFSVGSGVPVTIDITVTQGAPHRVLASLSNLSQTLEVQASTTTLWGTPADASHDPFRGECLEGTGTEEPASKGLCPANVPVRPFMTMPRSCQGAPETTIRARAWWTGDPSNPGASQTSEASAVAEDELGQPVSLSGCASLGYAPQLGTLPTSPSAETGSGLEVSLDFHDEGISNPEGIAHSDTKQTVLTFPEGLTVNPSVAEGLAVCHPAELARETLRSGPGEGCPQASKLGSLLATTPLIEKTFEGSIFLAPQDDPATPQPGAENPFDSLIAVHFVIRDEELGVLVKLAVKVEPDPRTGRLVASVDDLPQIPLSHFEAHLRAGERAPLITPPRCDTYRSEARLTPWARPNSPVPATASFKVERGVNGGPCPSGGVPPFSPRFEAGSRNNDAAAYSPFDMRLQRADGEQDMTKFSATLPPGVVGKLAGLANCPEAGIAAAKARSGRAELASPSCPKSSRIGSTLAGAGVGGALTYVPGSVYLAGPYNGAPLSAVAITPAVAGPFDAGTVVVREALRIDPLTAEVRVDGDASDPIPHILKGIVLKVRDLRVHVDREGFTLNPTSCDPSEAKATLFGSFLDVLSPADDRPAALASRYQAAGCQALGFKPRLSLALKGGTKRGGHPALTGTFRPRAGEANLKRMVLRLPRSAFLDQAHIRTICTRVQFAADACPKGAVYGTATAWTPLLDEPLKGPVYLRSSTNKLPDFVADLHGLVDVEAVARIDSKGGGIRATFPLVPDAPLTKVVVKMQGAKKGLIVNSRDLCAAPSRADARMSGHNGKRRVVRPIVKARCGGEKRGRR